MLSITPAWRTCRDACRDRYLGVSFEIVDGENVPGIPDTCATRIFTYLVRAHGKSKITFEMVVSEYYRMLQRGTRRVVPQGRMINIWNSFSDMI